ncbi:MAG: alpha/beta hydrolase fold domain-containing protein [Blastocatellia bacterium]
MKWMFDLYTAGPKERREIYVSPLRATAEQLKGLQPALIQVAESESCATRAKPTGTCRTRPAPK